MNTTTLGETYPKDKVMNKLSLALFNISVESLPNEIIKLANNFTGKRDFKIKQRFNSTLDFLAILYHLRFVEKHEISEIARILNFHVENIHYHLYNLRWSYSKDYIENQAL